MIKLIVGLGNIGAAYSETRHNAGFWLVEKLAEEYNISLSTDKKFFGRVGRGHIAGQEIRLLLPDTLMNLSGKAVAPMLQFYQIKPNELLVVHDELDIKAGAVKLKTGGGHGGHNGLRDIMPHTKDEFHRLRLGIGRPADGNVSGFVLSKPSLDDRIAIDRAISHTLTHLPLLIQGDIEKARNFINSLK